MARDPKTIRSSTEPGFLALLYVVFPCQDLGISTVQLGLSEHPPHVTVGLGNHLDMKVSQCLRTEPLPNMVGLQTWAPQEELAVFRTFQVQTILNWIPGLPQGSQGKLTSMSKTSGFPSEINLHMLHVPHRTVSLRQGQTPWRRLSFPRQVVASNFEMPQPSGVLRAVGPVGVTHGNGYIYIVNSQTLWP